MAEVTAAAAAIQLVAPPLGEVVGFGLTESRSYLGKIIASSKQLDERHRKLKQALDTLLALKEDNDREVKRRKRKATTNTYNLWINMASEIVAKVDSLSKQYEQEKKSKLNIWKRSRLSEKIATKHAEVQQLLEQCPNDILFDKLPEPVLKELGVPQIMEYPTLQGAADQILALLKNCIVKVIGVCGTKGVGKTTIMRSLNNNEEVAKLFDIVIFIRVLANQTDHEIQQKIADRLMVDSEGNTDPDEVARRIYTELEKKIFLLILDGVVDRINLNHMGIPNNNSDSKVVLATPFPYVCKLNRVNRRVNIMQLSPDEAWKMFQDIVKGSPYIDFSAIEPIARLICKRCSCLPLLIHMIAMSFIQRETISSWNAGLENLKPWPQLENQGLEELYSCLKFCYDQLNDKKTQRCFLYTSLYPADSKVYTDYLVECLIAHGFLGNVNATTRYQSMRNQGIATLEDLINVALLERGEQMMYVSMNDCIRQLALHISSKDPECKFYIKMKEFEEPSGLKSWQDARWVSMIDSKMNSLPRNQDCGMLQTLLLQKNSELVIPQASFDNMHNLLVLDLFGTKIRQLPSSLSRSTALKALYLNDCSLLNLLPSEIESLQLLEILDIRGTAITFIPSCIKCLINLRCLRIPYIKGGDQSKVQGVDFDHDVISKLYKLEELIIEVISHEQWCSDAKYILQQAASLENLTTFRCSFPSLEILGEFLNDWKSCRDKMQFSSFQFFVGCENSKHPKILESFEPRNTRYVKYCNGEKDDVLALSEILPQTDAFELICHKDVTNLSEFVGTSSLNHVRGFSIERCNKISTIVAGDQIGTVNGIIPGNESLLPNLNQLYLDNLLHLRFVFRGPLNPGSFSKLHTLTLKNCPVLKSIFFKVAIQDFPELKKLLVQDCKGIEELIKLEVTERELRVLPKLEMLRLDNLSELKSICGNKNLAWLALELLNIWKCPKLESLPFNSTNATNLQNITGEQEWWKNLKWTDNKVQERFESAFSAST